MGYVSQGNFVEAPEAAADEAYGSVTPSFGEVLGAEALSTVHRLTAAGERGSQEGSSLFEQSLADPHTAVNAFSDPGISSLVGSQLPEWKPEKSSTISAEDANKRFAPEGTTITDKPVTEGLARILGQQKTDQVQRQQIIARYQNAHSWPVNFGTGLAGFMLDPLNVSSLMVPGIGEDAVLGGLSRAGLGTGIVTRTLARAGAGASAGVAGQVPLSALNYALSPDETTDYGLRDAATDVLFGAAGGAILHAGLGLGLRETGLLGPDAALEAAATAQRRPVRPLDLDPTTNRAAMSAAVSQLVDGRPVDVTPVFHASMADSVNRMAPVEAADISAALDDVRYARAKLEPAPSLFDAIRDVGGIKDDRGDVAEILQDYRNDPFKKRVMSDEGLSPDAVRGALQERGWFGPVDYHATTGERPGDAVQDLYDLMDREARGDKVFHPESDYAADLAGRRAMDEELDHAGVIASDSEGVAARKLAEWRFAREYDLDSERFTPAKLAQSQEALYRDGYTPGLSAGDLADAHEDIYSPKSEPAAPQPQRGEPQGSPTVTPQERDLADLERRWQAVADQGRAVMAPEERALLDDTDKGLSAAGDRGPGLMQAGECLDEAGL